MTNPLNTDGRTQTALGRWGPGGPEGQTDLEDGSRNVRPESHHEGLPERLDKPQKTQREEAAHSPGRKVETQIPPVSSRLWAPRTLPQVRRLAQPREAAAPSLTVAVFTPGH